MTKSRIDHKTVKILRWQFRCSSLFIVPAALADVREIFCRSFYDFRDLFIEIIV